MKGICERYVTDRIGAAKILRKNRKVISEILIVLLLTITISHVNGTEVEKVTVEPGRQKTVNLSLEKGQKLTGSLTIVTGNEIDFWIVAPTDVPWSEDHAVELHIVNQGAEFEFVAKESGTHLGIFRNLLSSESAIIELSYDIYSPIKIIVDFYTLVLISVGLVAVVIIVIWWKS